MWIHALMKRGYGQSTIRWDTERVAPGDKKRHARPDVLVGNVACGDRVVGGCVL
jgi:hypothetical protein